MSRDNAFLGKDICCVVNPCAARNKWQRRKRLRGYLQKNIPAEIVDTEMKREGMINLVKEKCLKNDVIVAVGGDGTMADVLQGIVESGRSKEVCLGIIPLGSGNAFRRSFKIPRNWKKALRILAKGEIREMDLIDIDGKIASFASIGATAQVTLEKLKHRIHGLLGHLLASRIMLRLPAKEQEIELFDGLSDDGEYFDRKKLKVKVFECIVGKTNYFGYNWKAAPKARIDDGFLDITLLEISGPKYFLLFPLIYFGLFQKRQKHFKARRMVVRGKDLPLQYNGEALGIKDSFEFKILPRALKIICPAEK
jgi:diacylglycerol kinase family enzyme